MTLQTAKGNFGMEEQYKQIISYRTYITDTIDVAAIIAKHSEASLWLEQLQSSFEQPCSIPYLGRKNNSLSSPLTKMGERNVNIESFDDLAERLSQRIESEQLGNWHCSKYLLRTPKNLFKHKSQLSQRWISLGEKVVPDHRSCAFRLFSSTRVTDYLGFSRRGIDG